MHRFASRLSTATAVVLLAACGSAGGSGAGTPNRDEGLRVVEKRYDNGQLAEQGTVLDTPQGALRHGQWRFWFRDGDLRWQGSYVRDAIDGARPWREWNDDGSVRNDWRDAVDDASDG